MDELELIFKETLGVPPNQSVEELFFNGTPAWDSVGHMELVSAIEEKFEVKFSMDEILDLESFDDFRRALERKKMENGSGFRF